MAKEDSLYDQPAPKKEKTPVVQAGLPPSRSKPRMARNSILTLLLMLGLLGAAIYVAYQTDLREERPEFEDVTLEDMTTGRGEATNPPVRAEWAIPEVDQSLEDIFTGNDNVSNTQLSPEELASAMEAIRIARSYARNKEWDLAEIQTRRALDVWPAMNVAQRMLGLIYTQKGQFDQAITMFNQALTTDPFSAETYSNLATAYMHKGQMNKAEEHLNTALKMQPNFILGNLNLGMLYLATGRYDGAAEHLQMAVDKMPKNPEIRNNLAVSLLRIGEYEGSRQHLQMLINADQSVAYAYFNIAITYTLEGNFQEAMNWIKEGSRHCSPIAFQQFISDPDFQELHVLPEFQSFIQEQFGVLPEFNG